LAAPVAAATHVLLRLAATACLAISIVAAPGARAQGYPTKPIRIVVTSAAGGSVDTVARTLAAALTPRLGQQIIADNRPGAGGTIAASFVARAPADGHTLILGTAPTLALNVSLYRSLPYDPVRDFAPVSLIGAQDLVLLIHPSIPAKSVRELVAIARRNPGQLSYASAGNGTVSHLSGELLSKLAGIQLLHVPYKGSAAFMIDVISGQISMTFNTLLSSKPHVTAGKVRALAVSGTRRAATFPELPTMAEAGMKGFEATTWYGVLAPAGTSHDVVARLNTELFAVLKQPETVERLTRDGIVAVGTSPQAFGRFIHTEIEKWRQVIRGAGIEPL
jgi:tripartite-type tricarboxylate transporter receptor subunit TctC